MKEQKNTGRKQNREQHKTQHEQERDETRKGMNREREDEVLTTGGPVDRSAIEEQDNNGFVNARSGISMEDEEANPSKDDFPAVKNSLPGSEQEVEALDYREMKARRAVKDSAELDDEEEDINTDKTEGIVNPRSSVPSPAMQSGQEDIPREGGRGPEYESKDQRGENNDDASAGEYKGDVSPV